MMKQTKIVLTKAGQSVKTDILLDCNQDAQVKVLRLLAERQKASDKKLELLLEKTEKIHFQIQDDSIGVYLMGLILMIVGIANLIKRS